MHRVDQGKTYLYRLFSETNQLLYVGITNAPGRRLDQHSREKWWWWKVKSASWQEYPTRRDALSAESKVIREDCPIYNVVGANTRAFALPHALPCWECWDYGALVMVPPWDDTPDHLSLTWTTAHECRVCRSRWTVSWDYPSGNHLEEETYYPAGWRAA